ncbi:MAG TPA: molybdopterin cofactor-binding domain-containing protein [Chloroflexota bacterium]|nr:molybdopterin cofactor-binding domain-containing protein [Chloroflexota bacterium]
MRGDRRLLEARTAIETLGYQEITRRDLLKASGALVIGFSFLGAATPRATTALAQGGRPVPADLLDSWLSIAPDNSVTLFTGKVELGTGVQTAMAQIAAEELGVALDRMNVVMGDTALTVDQGATDGSRSISSGGVQVRQAAAEARNVLLQLASERLGAPADALTVEDGLVSVVGEPLRQVTYGELLDGRRFEREVTGEAEPKSASEYTIVGQPVSRMDLPAKLTGAPAYVQDVRLPGMLHARVIKPPAIGSNLLHVDDGAITGLPGIVRVIVRGNFVGVVAEREEQAIDAAERLNVTWSDWAGLPKEADLYSLMRAVPSEENVVSDSGGMEQALATSSRVVKATYLYPYQTHGSIGPSCAVADVREDGATIWSPTQGPHRARQTAARLLGLPVESVRVVWTPGAGCYGSNGADDATMDAAILSQEVGRPVRLQWMRQDEHRWANAGPAMIMDLQGGLDSAGRVTAWDYQALTPSHFYNDILTERLLNQELAAPDGPPARSTPWGGEPHVGYAFGGAVREVVRQLQSAVLRSHPLRAPGQVATTFAIESFMDELATAAKADPIAFRLAHLTDARAIAVLKAAAERARWEPRSVPQANVDGTARGRGVALALRGRTYVAMIADVRVDRSSGAVRVERATVAHDCGQIINPDGVRNQIEGNVIQTTSRALKEELHFDQANVTSVDWVSYPILTFSEVPDVDIVLIDHPELPPSGVGEPASCPVTAAIANAIFDAVGVRVRQVPFTPARVQAALDAARG